MSIIYKKLSQDNVEQYYNLVNAMKDEGDYLFSTLRFQIEETYKYVKRHEENNSPIWGAFDEEKLVGWIDYNRGSFPEIEHTASIGMGIQSDYRKKGIGTKLLKRCIESAKSQGIEKFELEVFGKNIGAYNLYKKMGFSEEGRRIKIRKYNDEYDDLIIMGLFL